MEAHRSAPLVSCGPPTTDCSGKCLDLNKDPDNCGKCGSACPAGSRNCSNATCTPCPPGLTECSNYCVDTQTDFKNCSVCGKQCLGGEACLGGTCISGNCSLTCPPGNICCGAGCYNPLLDGLHCGGCNKPCSSTMNCIGGKCACIPGLTDCSGKCVVLNSPENCGACGLVCPTGSRYCATGNICSPCSLMGLTECNNNCVSTQVDLNHCGGCNKPCQVGQACVAGTCISGNCSLTCTPGQLCCPPNNICCDNACVSPLYDAKHCGGCNKPCSPPSMCGMGVCK